MERSDQRTCFGSRGSGVQISPSRLGIRLVTCGNAGHLRFWVVPETLLVAKLCFHASCAYLHLVTH